MKILLQIVLALVLAAAIGAASLEAGVRFFIRDVVELQVATITGAKVSFSDYTLDWKRRSLQLNGLCLSFDGEQPGLCMETLVFQMRNDFIPVFSNASFFPVVSVVDRIEASRISVVYEIDDNGKKIFWLKARLSAIAADAMRDRLNAASGGNVSPLLFQVAEVGLTDINVDAVSRASPNLSKKFKAGNIALLNVGVSEGGVTIFEIIDQALQKLSSIVQVEVDRNVDIERSQTDRLSVSNKTVRKRSSSKEEKQEEDKGAGKDIKDLWKKTKSFFE